MGDHVGTSRTRFGRRQFLLGAAVVLPGAASALLTACGSSNSNGATSGTGGANGSSSGSSGSGTSSPVAGASPQASTSSGPAKKGGTLTIGQVSTPVSLDPIFQADWNTSESINYMYDHLTMVGGDNNARPWLATSWEMSKDGLTWTFHLQSGVKFHDGTDFDATACKFTFDRMVDKSLNSKNFANYSPFYDSSKAVDPTTWKVTLKKPWAGFLSTIATTSAQIVSPAAVKKYGKDFAAHPVGTGPFMFQSYTPDASLKMVRNPNYWKNEVLLDSVEIQIIPNMNTQVLDMETKKLDWIYNVTPSDVDLLKQHGVDVIIRPFPQQWMLMLNLAKGPTTELPVRQAIAQAINRDAIIKAVFKGYAEPSQVGVPKQSPFYHGDIPELQFDPNKAKATLDQAGWKAGSGGVRSKNGKPLAVTLLSTTQWPWPDTSQIIQEELSQIGFQAKIQSQEWGTFLNSMRAGSYDVAPWELRGDSFNTSDGTAGMLSTTYWNVSQITKQPQLTSVSQQIDTIINKEQSALSIQQRSDELKQFQVLVAQNQLLVWLWHPNAIFAVQSNVKGYTLYNYMMVYLNKAWLA